MNVKRSVIYAIELPQIWTAYNRITYWSTVHDDECTTKPAVVLIKRNSLQVKTLGAILSRKSFAEVNYSGAAPAIRDLFQFEPRMSNVLGKIVPSGFQVVESILAGIMLCISNASYAGNF